MQKCYNRSLEIKVSGGIAGGVIPVLIPNTEVKPSMADDTWIARSWESRLLPDLNEKARFIHNKPGLFASIVIYGMSSLDGVISF